MANNFQEATNAAGFVFHQAQHNEVQQRMHVIASCGVCSKRLDVFVPDALFETYDVASAVRRQLTEEHPSDACPGMRRRSR